MFLESGSSLKISNFILNNHLTMPQPHQYLIGRVNDTHILNRDFNQKFHEY